VTTLLTLDNVMTDAEPIGLAESFRQLDEPIPILLVTDEPEPVGAIVYFGVELPIGEIGEVRGIVTAVDPGAEQATLSIEVDAVDADLADTIVKCFHNNDINRSANARQPVWGVGMKQTNGAFAIVVNAPAGIMTSEQLAKVSEIAAAGAGKLTHAQRAVILVNAEQLDGIDQQLAEVGLRKGVLHHGIRNIRACCGQLCKWCRDLDAVTLAGAIDARLYGRSTKLDIKIAISDCQRNCSESYCADIGLLGSNGNYRVVLGGRGSSVPFRAINFANNITAAKVVDVIVALIDWYEQHAEDGERLWKTLQRLGLGQIRELDFAAVTALTSSISDGIDEAARLQDLLARIAGAQQAAAALQTVLAPQ